MSCCVLKNEMISKIASMIYKLELNGSNYFGFGTNEKLSRAVSSKSENMIYELLKQTNIKAWEIRYREKYEDLYPEYISHDITQPKEYVGEHYVIKEWHYELYDILKIYLYNCAESTEIEKSDLFTGLTELKDSIADFIVSSESIAKRMTPVKYNEKVDKVVVLSPIALGEFYLCDKVTVVANEGYYLVNKEFHYITEFEGKDNIEAVKAYCKKININPCAIIEVEG